MDHSLLHTKENSSIIITATRTAQHKVFAPWLCDLVWREIAAWSNMWCVGEKFRYLKKWLCSYCRWVCASETVILCRRLAIIFTQHDGVLW